MQSLIEIYEDNNSQPIRVVKHHGNYSVYVIGIDKKNNKAFCVEDITNRANIKIHTADKVQWKVWEAPKPKAYYPALCYTRAQTQQKYSHGAEYTITQTLYFSEGKASNNLGSRFIRLLTEEDGIKPIYI